MTAARLAHVAGTLCGLAVLAVAAVVLGGPWWVFALLAATGSLAGPPGSLVHAVGTLALAGGAAAADEVWLVPLLVLGVVATVESSALPERASRVRPRAPLSPALVAPLGAGAAAAAVLALSGLGPAHTVPTTLAGVLGALLLLTILRA